MFLHQMLACLCMLALCFVVNGQQLTPDYCVTMRPNFNVAHQTLPAPFVIKVNRDKYSAGDALQITINSTSNVGFRGFLIEARRADTSQTELDFDEPIGYFQETTGTSIGCFGKYGNALAQDGRNGFDGYVTKTSMDVIWTAPTPSQGHLIFKVTIIANEEQYWVAEDSSIVNDPNAPPMPTPTPDKAGSADLISIDLRGCGKTKGCYRNPEGCTAESCDMLVTWVDKGSYIDFEMTGDSDGWVAVGFSDDKKMGKDDVMECVWNEDLSVVEIRQSYNEESNRKNKVMDNDKDAGLSFMEGYMSNDRIRCSFRRAKYMERERYPYKFDLTGSFHILMTRGEVKDLEDTKGVPAVKAIHVLEPGKYPYVTPGKVSLDDNLDLTGTCRYPLVKVHGILMVLAWMLCASTALLMAKYYKPMWPNDRLCTERVWFAVHRGLMITVLILTIIAFILIFVHVGGYSWMPWLPEKAHPPLGITVMILVILNPILAVVILCLIEDKSHPIRTIFNWLHWFLGTVAYVLATPTMFIGLNLPKAHVPWWATWVMVVFMLFHLIIELLLEIHGCINGRKQKLRDEEFELRKKNDTRGELYGREPEPVGRRFKKRVLAVYLVVVIFLALIMVIAIAIG